MVQARDSLYAKSILRPSGGLRMNFAIIMFVFDNLSRHKNVYNDVNW